MRTLSMIICLLLVTLAGVAQASHLKVSGTADFIALGKPGFIKVHGQGAGLTGDLVVVGDTVSGDLIFPLDKLNTGVSLRDKHLKEEFLEVGKFPEAKLSLKDLKLPGNPTVDGFSQTKTLFTGVFTCHGISNPISGTIDLSTKAGKTIGDAQFEIKISDYGFRKPEYLGMKIENVVPVTAHIETQK